MPTPGDPSGNLGRFEGGVYRTSGGAPIDSLAQPVAASVQQGNVVITFKSGRSATWQYGVNTFQLYSLQEYPGIDGGFKLPEGLAGKWLLTSFAVSGGVTGYGSSYVFFTDAGTEGGKRVFNASCLDQCLVKSSPTLFQEPGVVDSVRASVGRLRITYDPVTRELRNESRSTTESLGWSRDLLVTSPNELQGSAYLGANGLPTDGGTTTDLNRRGLRLIRLPPDFRF